MHVYIYTGCMGQVSSALHRQQPDWTLDNNPRNCDSGGSALLHTEQVRDLNFFKTVTGIFVKRSICFPTPLAHNETTFHGIHSLMLGNFSAQKAFYFNAFKITSIKEGMGILSPGLGQLFLKKNLLQPTQAGFCSRNWRLHQGWISSG